MADQSAVERLFNLRQHQQGGVRSPHKPLLVLFALGRFASTGSSAVSWRDDRSGLAAQSAAYPFTRLRADGVWLLSSDVPMDDVRALEKEDVVGRLAPVIEDELADPADIAPSVEMVPEQKAAVTPTGRPTLRKRNKSECNELYTRALGSTVLATAKEALAVAVAADEARVLVLCKDPSARSAGEFVGVIYLGSFDRTAVARGVDPIEALLAAPGAEILRKGTTKEIANLRRPDLQLLVNDFAASLR